MVSSASLPIENRYWPIPTVGWLSECHSAGWMPLWHPVIALPGACGDDADAFERHKLLLSRLPGCFIRFSEVVSGSLAM